jgi:DNA-binding NarL/FixJ family response regulator
VGQTRDAVERGNEARPISVLIADDSTSLRALVRITLTSQGWDVSEAETAEAALAMTRSLRPDLAILDITFGDTGPDGLAICRELKSDPKTAMIPIVILTAHDDPLERARAEDAHANAFVTKPFGPLDLLGVVRKLMPSTPAAPALGVYLLDAGAVEPIALEAALEEQKEAVQHGTPKRLGDVLLQRGSVSGSALDRALLEQMHARAVGGTVHTIRVLVVDDHMAVREGLKALINGEEGFEVVGEAVDADEGLRLARRHRPDIIVLDNEMPGRHGLDIIPTLRAEVPFAKLVMFSLDSSLQARALAAGAHTFIAKDAPMEHILEALRPMQPGPVPQAIGSEIVPSFRSRVDLRRAATTTLATLAIYAGAFLALEPTFGASAGAFSVLPVLVIGGLLGPEAGIVGAILTLLATWGLWALTGHSIGEPVLTIGVPGFGIIVLLLMGFGAGAMRLLGVRLDPRRRRVEAIAEAARALAGLSRGAFIDAFLEAMLEVVTGDIALLFSNAAGEARFVAASRPIRGAEALGRLARDTMRAAAPRVLEQISESESIFMGMQSAVIVPVSVAGQDVRGALVVLHRERGRFGEEDIARIRPFAQYLWIVLRSAPMTVGESLGRPSERAS